jgi:hypothetical protein
MRKFGRFAPLLTAVALFCHANVARAAGPCGTFSWDVHQERALFATQAEEQRTGTAAASAPMIALDKLYRLSLARQKQVAFAVPPGKKGRANGGYAGLVRLHVDAGGLYRVALSGRFWIDVVEQGRLVASADFTGAHGCGAPRKIVLYRLSPGDILLQVSGGASPQTELTVTPAPR